MIGAQQVLDPAHDEGHRIPAHRVEVGVATNVSGTVYEFTWPP